MDDAAGSKPPCYREDALAVVRALRDGGHVAYFAGGCVRDLLLGIEPKDYDVATDAVPQRVRALFRSTQAVGQAFGVILVRTGRSVVEVATFRSDGAYLDGRRPAEVRFTTAEEDARRRDFTINGLFLDPVEDQVIDYVGGKADLAARLLRAIGEPEARFAEDHLRLLRAVRFAARFGLSIDPSTREAIVHHAPQLARISPERVGDEVRNILTPATRAAGWRLLRELGLASLLYRFLPNKSGAEVANPSLLDHLEEPKRISLGLALSATTFDILSWSNSTDADKRAALTRPRVHGCVRALRQSLRISNDESDDLSGTLEGVAILLGESPPTVAALKRFLARPSATLTRRLMEAIAAQGTWPKRIAELREVLADLEQTDFAPAPLLTGDDLTAAGWTPGPLFKRILEAVYDAQLEAQVRTSAQALALANRLAGKSSQPPPSDLIT
jgi:poly(A) polymerase